MAGFSKHFAAVESRIEALSAISDPLRPLEEILNAAETGCGLEVSDAASLLAWGRDPAARAEIEAAAYRFRERLVVKRIEFIIPVYLTSFCQNECLYCGYRRSNVLAERVRSSLEEYERELDFILGWGHRQIELVLADDAEFGPDKLAGYVTLTKEKLTGLGGGLVALNAPAYEQADYRRLRAAGLDWVALWQESYHQPHFDRWHVKGSPKQHYEFRLDVWDRAVAAGFERVALGVLMGLFEWRYDVLALVEHGNYLRRTYGLEPYALGIPRLKPARGVLASQKSSRFTVSNDDFRVAVSVYHLAFPRARLFFSTREKYEFNMSMVAAGDLFTVDCETLPGAYLRGRLPGQFSIEDYPPRWEVAREFARRGFACFHLEPGTTPDDARSFQPLARFDPFQAATRFVGEHEEIRSRLGDWETAVAGLAHGEGRSQDERHAATAALRRVLGYFQTSVIGHCRSEEAILSSPAARHLAGDSPLENFRREHERFGIDLDRFERQIASYELSGDPTVLRCLGERMIRDLRRHLASEDAVFRDWLSGEWSSPREMECA